MPLTLHIGKRRQRLTASQPARPMARSLEPSIHACVEARHIRQHSLGHSHKVFHIPAQVRDGGWRRDQAGSELRHDRHFVQHAHTRPLLPTYLPTLHQHQTNSVKAKALWQIVKYVRYVSYVFHGFPFPRELGWLSSRYYRYRIAVSKVGR